MDSQTAKNLCTEIGLERARVEEFKGTLRGDLIQPRDEGYDEARKVCNGMIDRHPVIP